MPATHSCRFIPAGAGNSVVVMPWMVVPAVHPRGGGELMATAMQRRPMFGSSPRGRGTRLLALQRSPFRRFIPAGAGNSRGRLRWRCRDRFIPAGAGNSIAGRHRRHLPAVHPRGGGELEVTNQRALFVHGSSPRGRGTRSGRPTAATERRFIPAGAGNSTTGPPPLPWPTVHPRGGGELGICSRYHSSVNGSSPRGRGTQGLRQ